MYALMMDGEVRVYDAAGPLGGGGGGGSGAGGPLWACQIITHDPSPRSLGTERRGEHRRWRERVGLDTCSGPGKRTGDYLPDKHSMRTILAPLEEGDIENKRQVDTFFLLLLLLLRPLLFPSSHTDDVCI